MIDDAGEPLAVLHARIAELEAMLARQAERYRSIEEIAAAMGSTVHVDELIALVLTEVTHLMEAERATLFLIDEHTGELWSKLAQGAEIKEIRLKIGEGIAGHVAQTGEGLNVPDAYADPRFQSAVDAKTGFRTRTILCEPLRNRRGEIVGVIQALNKKTGPFRAADETLLAALGAQIAVRVENAKLYQAAVARNEELLATQRRLERKNLELAFLYETEREVAHLPEREGIAKVLERAAAAVDVEAGSIVLRAAVGDELYFEHATGPRSAALERVRLSGKRGIASWVIESGEPVLTNDAPADPRHHWAFADAIGAPARSILCVPLFADDRTVGALELINKRGGDFGDDDLKLVSLTATIVSTLVQQSRHREAQERASRLADLGQMLSGILHDFKTPMTIISGYAQLMVNERSAEVREQSCQNILRQFEHLSNMTREILAFARGESTILFRRIYVQKFLEEMDELLRSEFAARRIAFEVMARYRGTLRADEGKLRRLVQNIARNALEALPTGQGAFSIAVDKEGEEVVLTFTDTGPGIPEEILPRLFQSFVTKGKPNGTGLGLAIVKKIVDEHRGSITVQTAPNAGTTLVVRLPLDPEAAPPAVDDPDRPTSPMPEPNARRAKNGSTKA